MVGGSSCSSSVACRSSADGRERWEAIGRASKPLRVGTRIDWDEIRIEVLEKSVDATLLVARRRAGADFEQILDQRGHLPLPPYMRRADEAVDLERYQTVYARRTASAAAPTAGLHLTPELFERLAARGVEIARLELEIGLGTFRPVTADDLDDHPMHAETIAVDAELVQAVRAARARRRRSWQSARPSCARWRARPTQSAQAKCVSCRARRGC